VGLGFYNDGYISWCQVKMLMWISAKRLIKRTIILRAKKSILLLKEKNIEAKHGCIFHTDSVHCAADRGVRRHASSFGAH
jgi:hypothetical protein